MKKCLKCGTQLPDESLFCSNCGAPVTLVTEMNKNGIKKYAPYIIGAFALICLLGFLAYSATSDKKTIAPITESNLKVILNNMIVDESGDAVDKYCTELFKTKYKDACKKAEDEGYESPRLWWQYSDSDPEKCEIEGLDMVSDTEAKAKVKVISELYVGDFEVILKYENDTWLVDEIIDKGTDNNS